MVANAMLLSQPPMSWFWYSLLFLPLVVTALCVTECKTFLPYPRWFAVTALGISYGSVLVTWLIVWIPLSLAWAYFWPCCIKEQSGFDAFWTLIATWMIRNELMLMALVCVAASIWVRRQLLIEWRQY
jgi:hypothetical protein